MSWLFRPTMLGLLGAGTLLGGCSTLGGNIGGDFACRAPEGSCAPTTLIDEQATGAASQGASQPLSSAPLAGTEARTLRIVVAARRDAAGREHEAHVVHVTLPDPAGEHWRQPSSTGDLLRAIGQAVAPAGQADTSLDTSSFPPLPNQMFLPSPSGSASSGAVATPDAGAPGRSPLPGRVPLLSSDPEQHADAGEQP